MRDKNIGAATVVGRGIMNSSFVNNLKRSATIWNAPFRPSNVGPILRCEKARSFLSVKITKSVNTIVIIATSKLNS